MSNGSDPVNESLGPTRAPTAFERLVGFGRETQGFDPLDSPLGDIIGLPPTQPIPPEVEDPEQRSILLGEAKAGLQAGIQESIAFFQGAAAVGSAALGAEELANQFIGLAQLREQRVAEEFAPTVGRVEDIETIEDFARFSAFLLGEQVPIMASIIAGGGIGGVLGRMVGRRLISRGAAELIVSKFGTLGATAGGVASATGIETGATALEHHAVTGTIDSGLSFLVGLAKGSLEVVVPLALGSRLGLTTPVANAFFNTIERTFAQIVPRRLAVAAGAASVETITETLQETIDVAARTFVDENFDVLGPETQSRILNAAASGGLVGFVFGGLAGGGARPRPQAPTEVPRGPTVAGTEPIITPAPTEPEPLGLPAPTPLLPGPDRTVRDIEPAAPATPDVIPLPGPVAAPEEQLRTEVLVQRVDQEDTGGITVFLPPAEAAERVAFEGRRNVRLQKVRGAALEGRDVTATLRELPLEPENLTRATPGVFFAEEARAEEALRLAQQAVELRNLATQESVSGVAGGFLARLAGAEDVLNQAIQAGFRMTPPREGRGFIVVGETPELVETQDLPVKLPTDGETFELAPGRRFEVDIERVPRGQLSVGTVTGMEAALVEGGLAREGEVDQAQLRGALRNLQEQGRLVLPEEMTEDSRTLFEALANFARSPAERQAILDNLLERGLQVTPAEGTPTEQLTIVGQPPPGTIREVPADPSQFFREPGEPTREPERFHRVLADNDAVLADGSSYDPGVHKPGTAAFVILAQNGSLSSRDVRFMRRVEKFYTGMMQKLGMKDARLVLTADVAFTGQGLDSATFGQFHPVKDMWGAISLNLGDLRDDVQRIGIAAHEFGHFLGYTEFLRAPEGVRQQIISAYNRALIAANFGTTTDFRRAYFPPTRFETGMLDFASGLTGRQAILESTQRGPAYWFNFDEWFADQVSRWVQTQQVREPIDSVERFFKRLGQKIKKLFEESFRLRGLKIEDFQPEPEMQAYLDSLQRRRSQPGAVPISEVAVEGGAESAFETLSQDSWGGPDTPAAGNADTASTQDQAGLRQEVEDEARFDEVKELSDYFNKVVKWGWNVLQLADKNKHIVWLQDYVERAQEWYNSKMRWMSLADGRAREWRQISAEENERFAQFILDIDQMKYLSKKERLEGVERQPTTEELVTLARKYELSEFTFNADPANPGLYQKVNSDFLEILNEMERISLQDIRRTFDPQDINVEFEIAKVQEEFQRLRSRPYFPHSRFGDFSVVVHDRESKVVFMEQFATEREAKKAGAELLRGPFKRAEGFRVGVDKIPEVVQPFRGLPASLLERVRNKLQLTEEQKVWLDRFVVELAPSQSFRKRLTKRENIPGFSMDAMRGYANYFWHAANHMARIEHGDEMQRIIQSGQTDTSELRRQGFNVSKRREILDFLQDHHQAIMNPGPDWAQLRSFAFHWWLGFSPASAVVNFTQIPLVAWPYLSARFGDGATAALRRAMVNVKKMYLQPDKVIDGASDVDFKLIQLGIQQGFLEESQAMELAGLAEGANLRRLQKATQLQRNWTTFLRYSAAMFQMSERLNRRVTFRAAVELARQNPDVAYLQELKALRPGLFRQLVQKEGLSETDALAFLAGKDAVDRTQFEYAQWARPRFMRGRKGAFFTFFMFTQNMVWFTFNSPGNRKFLLMMLLMGGLMGLPGAEDLASIAKFIARNAFGEEFDVELELRKFLAETLGEDGELSPDLFLHGISRVGFGLPVAFDAIGIPFPSIDMSANIGLGQIIPGVRELGRPGLDFETAFSSVSTDIAGAAFGVGINLFKALSDSKLPVDDFKRWERAMPRSMRNVTRAYRFLAEERERTRTGATVVDFDPDDPQHMAEVIAQGLGFTPTRLSRKWDREIAVREVQAFWNIRRAMVLNQIDHAFVVKDQNAQRDMRAAVRKFNNDVPYPSMRITGAEIRRSRVERERRRRLFEAGVPTPRRDVPLAREVQELFPEVTDVEDVTGKR